MSKRIANFFRTITKKQCFGFYRKRVKITQTFLDYCLPNFAIDIFEEQVCALGGILDLELNGLPGSLRSDGLSFVVKQILIVFFNMKKNTFFPLVATKEYFECGIFVLTPIAFCLHCKCAQTKKTFEFDKSINDHYSERTNYSGNAWRHIFTYRADPFRPINDDYIFNIALICCLACCNKKCIQYDEGKHRVWTHYANLLMIEDLEYFKRQDQPGILI